MVELSQNKETSTQIPQKEAEEIHVRGKNSLILTNFCRTLFNKEGFEYLESDYDAPRKKRL